MYRWNRLRRLCSLASRSRARRCEPSLPPALLHGELHLAQQLVVVGDRLLGLARERDPHAREVHDDRQRPDRQRALGLLELVRLPVGVVDRFADGARLGLVLERHAVGEAHDLGRLVDREVAPVREPDLDDEGVAAIDRGRARARDVERVLESPLEPLDEQRFPDGNDRRTPRAP
jgi:hypothetical protein